PLGAERASTQRAVYSHDRRFLLDAGDSFLCFYHATRRPATAGQIGYDIVMPGNSFGELFRVTTAGVSHGPGYVCIVDGCPPGLPLSVDDLMPDLRRRRPGQSKIVSQRQEEDVPEIWSGA